MKKIILEEIYRKSFDGDYNIKYSDLPKDLQETDIIHIQREVALCSENNAYDTYTELSILIEREENDEEYQFRKDKEKIQFNDSKKRRYKQYIQLKKEFQDICDCTHEQTCEICYPKI